MLKIKSLFTAASLLFALFSTAQNFSSLDRWLDQKVEALGGRAVLVIYKDGKLVYNQAVNEMSRRQKLRARILSRRTGRNANTDDFTINTKQRIASCSKWLSAALVMTFVDEGKLKLMDTIGRFVPVMSRSGKGSITIAQCLSHTTAILAPGLKESLEEMKDLSSMEESVNRIASLPTEGQPGKVFRYSNVGLQLAGAVVEQIGKKSFQQLFEERIARPLEMENTDWGPGKVPLPAGGAFSTAQDYLNFLTMILNKGMYKGKRILSEKSIADMQVNRITQDVKVAYSPAEAGNWGYGFGEWTMEDETVNTPAKAVSSPGLFGAFPWVDNEKKYCAFLFTFNLKAEGRNERYKELKALVDEAL
jgi:CubicO group peptidase (beta-lactamase class C family)